MNTIDLLFDPQAQRILWPVAALLLGLIVGSFANVCIHRIPQGLSIVAPRSRCPRCGHALAAWENVPVLSFLWLRARCRACRQPISWRYPAVEALNGLTYLGLALLSPPTLRSALSMAFASALLVLSLIDLEHFILPDAITLPGIAFGLIASVLPDSPVAPAQALASAAGAYLVFGLVAKAYQQLRGVEGLGQGDWKMAAMLGAFLGWQALLLTVFLASLAGTLVGVALMARGGGLRSKLPLGTFLGLAGLAVMFVGRPLLAWYKGFLR